MSRLQPLQRQWPGSHGMTKLGYVANVRCLEAMAKVETKPFGAADYLDIAEGNLEFAAILEVMRALDLKITARAG